MKILLAEHGKRFGESLAASLRADFYAVDSARDAPAARTLCALNEYDLLIVDCELPPDSGIELLRRWRSEDIASLAMVLDRRAGRDVCIEALDSGADDYVAWPFSEAVVLARVRALMRRRPAMPAGSLRVADIRMSRARHAVAVAGREIGLTPREFALLEYLMSRPDEVVSRTELIEHTWDSAFDPMSNVVDVAIHRLRAKIDDGQSGRLLHTVSGAGYVLQSCRTPGREPMRPAAGCGHATTSSKAIRNTPGRNRSRQRGPS